jgi:hypothetical protein
MFNEQWATDADKALSQAAHVTKDQVDGKSAEQVKAAATKGGTPS